MSSKEDVEKYLFEDFKHTYKLKCGPTAMFDCDDTLVMWDLPDGMDINDDKLVSISCNGHSDRCLPNHYNIELLKKFAKRGHSVVVWSAGGSDWAEAVVKALGLGEYVSIIMGKPNYFIDDIADPKKWMGKHGYFTLEGKRVHGDNIPNLNKE